MYQNKKTTISVISTFLIMYVLSKVKYTLSMLALTITISLFIFPLTTFSNQEIPTNFTHLPPCRDFKEYLTTLPWVQHVIYEQSFDDKFGLIEGALQPSGYYILIPGQSKYGTNLIAFGFSDHEWSCSERYKNLILSPKTSSWTNLTINEPPFSTFNSVIRLGFPLFSDSIQWISPVEFQFSTRYGHFKGKIDYYEDDRPVKVHYWKLKPVKDEVPDYTLTYIYSGNSTFPPSKFIINHGTSAITNIIHTLKFGIDKTVTNGYSMDSLGVTNPTINEIFVISNNVRYTINPDKSLKKYLYNDAYERRSNPIRFAIILCFILITVPIIVYWRYNRNKIKDNYYETNKH